MSEGEEARLECLVESFPRGPDTVKWAREEYDLGECSEAYLQLSSCHHVIMANV